MGSVACSVCGRVRWNPSNPCPTCGAPPGRVLSDAAIAVASPRVRSRRPTVLEPSFRVDVVRQPRKVSPTWSGWKRDWVAVILLGAAVLALLASVSYPTLVGWLAGGSPSAGTQTVNPAGTTYPLSTDGQGSLRTFTVDQPGELEGSYVVSHGIAWVLVCFEAGCGANYSGEYYLPYEGPNVQSGAFHVPLNRSGLYGLMAFPSGTDGSGLPLELTWETSVQVVH
ncbi:MAG: hypothetical protein L3J96_04860 [Thermoplasmata archaeon]|nr:hypothetical protein [Thermoplasmata archaeon]